MDSGYSLADIRAATDGDRDNDMMGGGIWWILILFLLLGGDGFGNRNKGADCVTQADLCNSQNFNQLENGVRSIQNGICDSTFALNNSINNGFHGVDNAICGLSHNMDRCCCETNRNIDALRYEGAKNTCDIVTAIHADGDATRALMTQNTIQQLRDELQSAQLTLAQGQQTQTIVNMLRPCPIPAYPSCNPWASQSCGCGVV